MKREMFLRIATTALRQNQGRPAEQQAEAIAQLMDTFAAVMGEEPPQAAYQSATTPAFPAPPSAAVEPVAPEPVMLQQPMEPEGPPLITTDTRMPNPNEKARPSQIAKPGAGAMRVEDLNRLVQERTPKLIRLEVPMEDGSIRKAVWERNVISKHAFESVTLVYSPLNASPSVRELSEVSESISIHDLPVDLSAIVARLTSGAVKSITPRGPITSYTPPVGVQNPIQHPAYTYQSPDLTKSTVGVFNSIG